jgi:hypothetical protein
MRTMDIVEACGTSLAFPSQTVYLAHEPEAAEAAKNNR